MPDENARSFYRVEYPHPARPVLDFEGGTAFVLDCSESGFRYALEGDMQPPEPGTRISGRIKFNEGREVPVTGQVKRLYGKSVAVAFNPGAEVPFAIILKEQKFLRSHYRI